MSKKSKEEFVKLRESLAREDFNAEKALKLLLKAHNSEEYEVDVHDYFNEVSFLFAQKLDAKK